MIKINWQMVALLMAVLLLSHCTIRKLEKKLPNALPQPISNNAVAYLRINDQDQFYSFNGLTAGKTFADVSNEAYVWKNGQWLALNVPEQQLPVLASTAVAVNGSVYLFGGYTVAKDHSEKSIPNVWRIDGQTDEWFGLPVMPIPVDDAVALVYQNRYIYLISGWHDVDNVDLVQVFDTQKMIWQQATPFPLPPVFGHAGGIIGHKILICDGVKVVKTVEKKQFLPSAKCTLGSIDVNDPTLISWQQIPHHSGTAYYRMAASSDDATRIYFAGGSDNPYNYNGIGYNTVPSEPSNGWRVYDLISMNWLVGSHQNAPSMDHRALLNTPHGLVIMGGMAAQQKVTDHIMYYEK